MFLLHRYDESISGNIATIYTTMKDFSGPFKMFLKKRSDGKYFALITPEEKLTGAVAMPIYSKRWNIEEFFRENKFLGIDHLPSLNLNAIQMFLSLRLFAFQVLDNFRYDLGCPYNRKKPEILYREFIDGVQGMVQLKGDNTIVVKIYGFEQADAAASLFISFESKLRKSNIDPRAPLAGKSKIEVRVLLKSVY